MANDDNVISIRTRKPDSMSPTWAMTQRLISIEGVYEIVAVIRDIVSDTEINPFPNLANGSELNDEVARVLHQAVIELEKIEDRASGREV